MSTDWLPGRRDDVLNMGQVWMTVMAQKLAAWGIPQAEVVALVDLVATASSALEAARGADRSKTTTVRCRVAFEALEK
ncbi:MAG: hypothetical protein LBD09_04640, partial [Treponema sp.]|nr:hypothetical protein [Treponema sp.]